MTRLQMRFSFCYIFLEAGHESQSTALYPPLLVLIGLFWQDVVDTGADPTIFFLSHTFVNTTIYLLAG